MGGSVFCHGFIGNKIHAEQQRKRRHYCRGMGLAGTSHTPQGVFSSFTGQTEVCPFTRAAWRVFIYFPTYGSLFNALPSENEIQPAAGRNPALGRSKSSLRSDEICVLRTQTMKPRNLFGFGASFTLAAIYSRGTCRPTRRPTAVRAASQTALRFAPALRG